MAGQQARKLNLALYLDPKANEADGVATNALQQWYEAARQRHGEGSDLDEAIRGFHHDLYLAGLCLYRIDPRLCRQVADALAQQGLSLEQLLQQLSTGQRSETPELARQLAEQGEQLSAMQAELQKLSRLAEDQAQQLSQLESTGSASPKSKKAKANKTNKGAEEMDVSGMEEQIAQVQKVREKGVF